MNIQTRHACMLCVMLTAGMGTVIGGTVVFYEKSFPSIENGVISRVVLEEALGPLKPRFVGLSELRRGDALGEGDLLVLPYGSAVPADAWETIHRQAERGNLLVLGGRPFFVPMFREGDHWRSGGPQNTYARFLGIEHAYEAPQHGPWKLQWDKDAPVFHTRSLHPERVFVNAGRGGRYRGLGFLVNQKGDRLAAPVVAEDLVDRGLPPRRRVYLSFDAGKAFWDSQPAKDLVREAALYASRGGIRLWLDLQLLSLNPGDRITGAVDVLRAPGPAQLKLEVLLEETKLVSRSFDFSGSLHEELVLPASLREPGFYRVQATVSEGDSLFDRYTSGVWVRDTVTLRSGARLQTGRDYFTLDGRPYLMVGSNYFSTDPYTSAFFTGGSLGGNAWQWDLDFGEMESQGLTAVRTGIWLNRARYLDWVSGASDERLLRALEAYLAAAARHKMQVIFTFFAFDPQTVLEQGHGQEGNMLGPGSNPYVDPRAIESEAAYVTSIVSRFRAVPFLSYDLINEPSFSNPKRHWKGNSPNGDPKEEAAWQQWLKLRYGSIEKLAEAWDVPPTELGDFGKIPLPAIADLEPSRSENQRIVRAVDYNHFAQDAFGQWVNAMVKAIRLTGSRQLVTVGQDEGGVADRVLNQFWARSDVDYTVNHSWWRDDALLWNSVAAKTPTKPNLIGETGPQPVWSVDGTWRWDDIQGMPLVERKLVLGFADATAGVLHWDWTRSDSYGLLRRDGSQKLWIDALRGVASFARDAQAYTTNVQLPDIALVMPQSLQLSIFGHWGVTVEQNAVRALFYDARATAFAAGEYQLSSMPEVRLVIVPAPWIIHQEAWNVLMQRARAGATILISGRIDADEHWKSNPERTAAWGVGYASAALTSRWVPVRWPGDSATLSYSGDRTTYAERGSLSDGQDFREIPVGKGRILYFSVPLELADQLDAVGRVYRFAMEKAGVDAPYETSCTDPGILICPTVLPEATLYVLTSESAKSDSVSFRDLRSGTQFRVPLASGRAALLLAGTNGQVLAKYNIP